MNTKDSKKLMGTRPSKKASMSIGGAASVILIAACVISAPQVRAELVYQEDVKQPQVKEIKTPKQAGAQLGSVVDATKEEDRGSLRQVLGASEKAKVTNKYASQDASPMEMPAPPILISEPPTTQIAAPQNTQQSAQSNGGSETQNLSKSEMLRRERMRQELRNEDLLQERLEELRLRDEQRRTDQVLGSGGEQKGNAPRAAEEPASITAPLPMKQEIVVPPVTEQRPAAVPSAAPTTGAPQSSNQSQSFEQVAVVSQNTPFNGMGMSSRADGFSSSEKTLITIQPRGGLAQLTNQSGYDVHPHYSLGIGVGFEVSDHMAFEGGYTYSEYGMALSLTNPTVQWAQGIGYTYNPTAESIAFKQNVADLGLKLYLLGRESRIRPFIGGGGAYSKGYLNYDQNILNNLKILRQTALASDYEISQFLGFLSAGLDIQVTRSVAVSGTFKYFSVLSAQENQNLNNYALLGGYPSYGSLYSYNTLAAQTDIDKQIAGGSLAQVGFYTINVGINFAF